MKPYTYLIGWSKHNKYYYGVRYAQNCHPSDLWVTYFTSSKHVKKFREEYGEPNIREIRKIFETELQARNWEHKVIVRLDLVNDSRYLNKSDNVHYLCSGPKSKETVEKMRQAQLGKRHTIESRQKMSKSKKGCTPWNKGKTGMYSDETIKKMKTVGLGRKQSEESKRKKSEALKGRPRSEEVKRKISEGQKRRVQASIGQAV